MDSLRGQPNPESRVRAEHIDRSNVMSLAEIFKSQPLFGRKVGKFSVAIEFELLDVMTAFFDEKI